MAAERRKMRVTNEMQNNKIENCFFDLPSKITVDNYYTAYFKCKYYVGRITAIDSDEVTFQFLYNKSNTCHFNWPLRDDISVINYKLIFHGPLIAIGTVPFTFDVKILFTEFTNFRYYVKEL